VAARSAGTRGADQVALLKNLEDFLVAVTRQGKRALLVVDEAQNLTPRAWKSLRMLSKLPEQRTLR